MVKEFAKGNVQITLSQDDMAKAIEYWLNERVLKNPCTVLAMSESRVNTKSTFEVKLAEKVSSTAQLAAGTKSIA